MGITGLIPFLEKASKRVNVSEFSGCTVAVDSYCWLHKGAFACADKLVRGEDTDVYVKYCMKYVSMLLSNNIKPIMVFDGRHLPAKALTESKRRESRTISKKRAAELLSLGKIEEARSYMRRSIDISHSMALALIKECRRRNVDCIVAPYEADAQLAYLNINKFAHLVITEDSDLILFGCTKVLFKMDLDGMGILVDTAKLPLVMKCPIEHYSFAKFRQMCIMSGCDYLSSLPGIGLAKARQFVNATRDPNFANALKKIPSYFKRSSIVVSDEYRENFLKAEATFKHQYVYDPLMRKMVRLTDPDDEDREKALCVNAGELLEPQVAFELALGNLDPFTLNKMDDWHPDDVTSQNKIIKTGQWKDKTVSKHPSIWNQEFLQNLNKDHPWHKKVKKLEPIIAIPQTKTRQKVVNLVSKYVAETQDVSLTIEALSKMYSAEPANKRLKTEYDSQTFTQKEHDIAIIEDGNLEITQEKSPILVNKDRSFKKALTSGSCSVLRKLSRFPRTEINDNIIESKFFSSNQDANTSNCTIIEESPQKVSRNPFKVTTDHINDDDTECSEIPDSQLDSSLKENIETIGLEQDGNTSPILEPFRKRSLLLDDRPQTFENGLSEDFIENTYPLESLVTPVDSQNSFGDSPPKPVFWSNRISQTLSSSQPKSPIASKKSCKVPGLKRTTSLPSNQQTLLSKFGFQKKPVLKR